MQRGLDHTCNGSLSGHKEDKIHVKIYLSLADEGVDSMMISEHLLQSIRMHIDNHPSQLSSANTLACVVSAALEDATYVITTKSLHLLFQITNQLYICITTSTDRSFSLQPLLYSVRSRGSSHSVQRCSIILTTHN